MERSHDTQGLQKWNDDNRGCGILQEQTHRLQHRPTHTHPTAQTKGQEVTAMYVHVYTYVAVSPQSLLYTATNVCKYYIFCNFSN